MVAVRLARQVSSTEHTYTAGHSQHQQHSVSKQVVNKLSPLPPPSLTHQLPETKFTSQVKEGEAFINNFTGCPFSS